MKRLNYLLVAFALVGATAATAHAQDATPPPAAAPAAEPPPMAHPSHPLVAGPISYFTATTINSTGSCAFTITGQASSTDLCGPDATLQFGISGGPGFSVGIGVGFLYSSKGFGIPGDNTKFALQGTIFGAYYVYNKFPFAMGPELALTTELAGIGDGPASTSGVFNPLTILPGWQFLYAPFNAPVLVGTALDLAILIPKSGGSTIVTSLQPELRVVYAF